MGLREFLAAQDRNLALTLEQPTFAIVEPFDQLYERSISLAPRSSSQYHAAFLLICHKAYLSAAALIGRRQPDDAAGITRRAIEAACLGLAIKVDQRNVMRWLAHEKRIARWSARLENVKPTRLTDAVVYPDDHPIVAALRSRIGYFSDAMVHFTPELVHAQQDWKVQALGETVALTLNVFAASQEIVDIEILGLIETHLMILDLFDECYGGAFQRDDSWRQQRAQLLDSLEKLAAPFNSPREPGAQTEDEATDG